MWRLEEVRWSLATAWQFTELILDRALFTSGIITLRLLQAYLSPLIPKLRQFGDDKEQLDKTFQSIRYFGGNQMTRPLDVIEEKVKGEAKRPINLISSSSSSSSSSDSDDLAKNDKMAGDDESDDEETNSEADLAVQGQLLTVFEDHQR